MFNSNQEGQIMTERERLLLNAYTSQEFKQKKDEVLKEIAQAIFADHQQKTLKNNNSQEIFIDFPKEIILPYPYYGSDEATQEVLDYYSAKPGISFNELQRALSKVGKDSGYTINLNPKKKDESNSNDSDSDSEILRPVSDNISKLEDSVILRVLDPNKINELQNGLRKKETGAYLWGFNGIVRRLVAFLTGNKAPLETVANDDLHIKALIYAQSQIEAEKLAKITGVIAISLSPEDDEQKMVQALAQAYVEYQKKYGARPPSIGSTQYWFMKWNSPSLMEMLDNSFSEACKKMGVENWTNNLSGSMSSGWNHVIENDDKTEKEKNRNIIFDPLGKNNNQKILKAENNNPEILEAWNRASEKYKKKYQKQPFSIGCLQDSAMKKTLPNEMKLLETYFSEACIEIYQEDNHKMNFSNMHENYKNLIKEYCIEQQNKIEKDRSAENEKIAISFQNDTRTSDIDLLKIEEINCKFNDKNKKYNDILSLIEDSVNRNILKRK